MATWTPGTIVGEPGQLQPWNRCKSITETTTVRDQFGLTEENKKSLENIQAKTQRRKRKIIQDKAGHIKNVYNMCS